MKIRTVVLVAALGGMALAGQTRPAHAGFFDQIGAAFGHLGQAAAGHKMSYAPGKSADDQTARNAAVTPSPTQSQVAAVPVATPPAPVVAARD